MRTSKQVEVVLLPGLDGTGLLFQPFLRAVGDDQPCRVVTYPPDRALSIRELAEVARRGIPAGRPSILVAESFSGAVTAELLARGLPGVRGVVLVAAFLAPPRPMLLRLARLAPVRQALRVPLPGRVLRRYCLGEDAPEETVSLLRRALRAVDPGVLAGRLRMLSALAPPSGRANLPACYIQAAGDRLVPADCAEAFRSFIPGIEIVRIDGPHFALQSRPDECWRIVRTLLHSCATGEGCAP